MKVTTTTSKPEGGQAIQAAEAIRQVMGDSAAAKLFRELLPQIRAAPRGASQIQVWLGAPGETPPATTKAAATPGEQRIQRSVSALRGLMGDDDLGKLLEGLVEQTRAAQQAEGGTESVVKFLKQGRA